MERSQPQLYQYGIFILYHFGIIKSRIKISKILNYGIIIIMRLAQLRKERKISQVKLAMDLNTNQNTISRYETGEREADYAMLIRISDYFNVSIDYLLERTDNPEINK